MKRAVVLLAAWTVLLVTPSAGQVPDSVRIEPDGAAGRRPALWYAAAAADSILSTPGGRVGLESFDGDTVTGVYLRGVFHERDESVAYGRDADDRRYVWFSVGRDSMEYIALLYDVDTDLAPDFLLFRTIDPGRRMETLLEYRAPAASDQALDVQINPACAPPRCDPETWSVRPRTRIAVPASFFDPWRGVFGLAATRGEAWLGKSRQLFAATP